MTSDSQKRPADETSGTGTGAPMTSSDGIAHGITIAASIVVFLWLGDLLDGRLGTSPLFAFLGLAFGAGASFLRMFLHMGVIGQGSRGVRKEDETS